MIPAKSSQAEKFCHMICPVCQKAISVRRASVKQTTGNGTSNEWTGVVTVAAVDAEFRLIGASCSVDG
jgi:hypothetical protein